MPSILDISNITVRIYDSSHVSIEGYQTAAQDLGNQDKIGFFWRQAQPGMHGATPFNVVLDDPSGAVGPSQSAQYDGSGERVLHIGENDGPFTFNTSFNGTGSGEPNSPAARVFLPGRTYYANAYYFINDPGPHDDGYFYENDMQVAGDEDNPPGEYRGVWANNPGMEFRIPDISGNYEGKTVTIDSDSAVTFYGLIEASGNFPDSSGDWSSWGTDASQVGFVWENSNNHILPTRGSVNGISYNMPDEYWPTAVPDASGFWITAPTIERGKRFWVRPWITTQFIDEDVGGIFYSTDVSHLDADAITGQYQDASAVPFTIPNITTVLNPDISNNSATLHASLVENGDVYGGPSGEKFQFSERGFYFDTANPPINKEEITTGNAILDTSWNSLGTSIPQLDGGLEAGVQYHYQGYGHINTNTTDGGIVGISGEIQTIQIPDISFNDYALGNASAPQNTFYGSIEAIGIGMEPSKAGFVYEINNSNHVLPQVTVGDASNIEQSYENWAVETFNDTTDETLLLGKRYWVRSYVQDTSGVYYYPTKHPQEAYDASAAEFTFPDPSATLITNITVNSATFNAILPDNVYFNKPVITKYGFYYDTSTSFNSPIKVEELGNLAGPTWSWSDTPAPLTARTTYYVKAFVDISNNRTGTIADISRNTYVSFTTLEDPPEIDNSGVVITTNPSGTYPNSIVTFNGNQSDAGSGPDETTQLGFFYSDTVTDPSNGTGTKVISGDSPSTIGVFDAAVAFANNGINNYVNAYAYSGADSYYYYADGSGGPGVPDPGVKFRIPDISTNSVTLDSSYAIIASATIDISGHPMDPSCVGFIFRKPTSHANDKFPIYEMTSLHYGETPNFSTWVVGPDTKTLTFDLTTEVGSVVGFQGKKFWINSYVRDASHATQITRTGAEDGTVYYAQNDTDGIEFTIPKVVTQPSSSIDGNSMIINADVSGGLLAQLYTYNSMPAITSYGFYFDENNPPTTIVGLNSSNVPLPNASWNTNPSGLVGRTDYYSQGFVYINDVGISGEIITTQTAKDPATVTTYTPLWAAEGINLRGELTYIGSGPDITNSWGFHLSDNVGFTPSVQYDVSGGQSPPVAALFNQDVSFNDLPNGYMRGHTYYYKSYAHNPATGPPEDVFGDVKTFIIPKVDSSGVKLISIESVVGNGSFTVQFDASLNVRPDPPSDPLTDSKQGFFYSDTVTDPSNGTGTKIEENLQGSTGIFDLNDSNFEHNKTYYFNSFIFDGVNYHYSGNDADYNTGNPLTFKIPSVDTSGVDTTYDLSGDRVNLDASHTELDGFTITNYGNYIYLDGSAEEKVDTQTGTPAARTWSFYKAPVIDILPSTLGGGALYNANSFITIDGVDICGNTIIPFTTPNWPTLQMLDVSRNVGFTDASGYAIMRARWNRNGGGVEEVKIAGPQGQFGFFINDAVSPNETNNITFPSTGISVPFSASQDFEIDSSKNGFNMATGTQYWINPFINGDITDSENRTNYYEYLSDPTTKSITLARKDALGSSLDFPVGFTIKIPDISNNNAIIIDSSTVRMNMHTDSSGATTDVSGVDKIGFFWNTNPSQCFFAGTDVSQNEIVSWDKSAGNFYLDANGITKGLTYYYSAYGFLSAGAGFAGPRGEGIDGNDYWYSPGYVISNSTNSVESFCIADPSAVISILPSAITETTVDLSGIRLGDTPRPIDASYGFYYWFGGATDPSGSVSINEPSPSIWDTITITNLNMGAHYFGQPSITQSDIEILGNEFDWYTNLPTCDVSLNDISANYINVIIDASLNSNPPSTWPSGQDGLLTHFGICWKPTDVLTDKATIADNSYNIVNDFTDVSYNGADIDISGNLTVGDNLYYNRRYSVRAYAENEPNVGQIGGGVSYSDVGSGPFGGSVGSSFVTLLPACTMNDPSMNFDLNDDNYVNYVDISGQIANNPDDTSGNVIKYGYCLKIAGAAVTLPSYVTPTIDDCDISTNYISSIGPPPSTNLNPPQPSDASFNWDASLNITDPTNITQADLSFNRQYFIKSYAENKSSYTGISDISYNIKDSSFSTLYPQPSIEFKGSLETKDGIVNSNQGYVEILLKIKNYDPTIWGGITEFGVIWMQQDIAVGENFHFSDLGDIGPTGPDVGYGNKGGSNKSGWYKRGDRTQDPVNFSEAKGDDPPSWKRFYDASYASQGTWPSAPLKLGIYNLYPEGSSSFQEPQDPSSTSFEVTLSHYIRPYIITKSTNYITKIYDASYTFFGDTSSLSFALTSATCMTEKNLSINYDDEGWPLGGDGTWGSPDPDTITTDSAELIGKIVTNPRAGEPDPSGKIIEYGFYIWGGGETGGANGKKDNLTWPGKNDGPGGSLQTADECVTLNYFNNETVDISINFVNGNNFDASNNYSGTWQEMLFPSDTSKNILINGNTIFNNTIWYAAYTRNYYNDGVTVTDNYSIGDVNRFEQLASISFSVDMEMPLDTNITNNTGRVYGKILLNSDINISVIKGYGFCWRQIHTEGSQWNYETNTIDENVFFPAPTIHDSSMVNLMITDVSNQEIINYDANGCFPGIKRKNIDCSGVTQRPPMIFPGGDPWEFYYNIGTRGEELKAAGGIVGPSGSVAFDASGGLLLSYHYYFVRSWVKAKKTNSTVEDDGEALSGIKYGPLWYPNPPNQTSHKKGYVFLTKKCPPCTLGNISYNNLEAFSLHLFSTILINPEPKKLIQFGFVYIKDVSNNLTPTIENSSVIFLTEPASAFTNTSNIQLSYFLTGLNPKTKYSVRSFSNNIHYDPSGAGGTEDTENSEQEGGISYSANKAHFETGYSPESEELIVSASNISYRTALFKGVIIINDYSLISEHGFCWIATENLTIKPTLDNSFNNLGPFTGTGPYEYQIIGFKKSDTNLDYDTSYNLRAWSKNPYSQNQITYSENMISFETLKPTPPNMGPTIPINTGLFGGFNDSFTTAQFGGGFGDSSGVEIIETFGLCWTSLAGTPLSGIQWDPSGGSDQPNNYELTLENAEGYTSLTDFQQLNVDGSFNFVSTMTGLSYSTTYYVRSYAKINPTGYGNVYNFTTPDKPCVCKPVVQKSVGSSVPRSNLSSKRLYSQRIQLFGSTIVEYQAMTPNLL
jgi:hypothetical protein